MGWIVWGLGFRVKVLGVRVGVYGGGGPHLVAGGGGGGGGGGGSGLPGLGFRV
jgi:hypothetical protein